MTRTLDVEQPDCVDVREALSRGASLSGALAEHASTCPVCQAFQSEDAVSLDKNELFSAIQAAVREETGFGAWLRSLPTRTRIIGAAVWATLLCRRSHVPPSACGSRADADGPNRPRGDGPGRAHRHRASNRPSTAPVAAAESWRADGQLRHRPPRSGRVRRPPRVGPLRWLARGLQQLHVDDGLFRDRVHPGRARPRRAPDAGSRTAPI